MNYLGKFIDNFKYVYKEINPATLTGAIDVIVVEQPDGTFTCSPFHVRFGKIGVLRSREKIVEIEINGELCDIHMKLGESGEAFFVEEFCDEDPCIPQHLVCSPIPYSSDNKENRSDSILWTAVSKPKESEVLTELNSDVALGSGGSSTLKTFHAKTVQSLSDCEIPTNSEFRPIRSLSEHEGYQSCTEIEKLLVKLNHSDNNLNSSNKTSGQKRKRRRKRKTLSNEFKRDHNKNDGIDNSSTIILDEILTNAEDTSSSSELIKTSSLKKENTLDDEIANLDLSNTQTTASIASDLHFFSDTDANYCNYDNKAYSPAQSDTEFEVSNRPKACEECVMVVDGDEANEKMLAHRPSWRWGELPSPLPKTEISELPCSNKEPSKEHEKVQRSMLANMLGFMKRSRIRNTDLEGSIYLSQLDADGLDPEIARLYLPRCSCMDSFKQEECHRCSTTFQFESGERSMGDKDEDVESGNGPSLAHSPVSEVETSESPVNRDTDTTQFKDDWDIAISLCGGLSKEKVTSFEQFNQHMISYDEFVNNTSIYKNPNLIFRINGKMYTWEAACPLILSYALYKKSLPQEVVDQIEIEKTSKNVSSVDNGHRRGYYSWFYWARTTQNKTVVNNEANASQNLSKSSEIGLKISTSLISADTLDETNATSLTNNTEYLTPPLDNLDPQQRPRTYSSTDSELESENIRTKSGRSEKFKKTLRLTSQQIAKLNLLPGANEVMFSVTTAYQGTTRCKCALFLWRYDDKIVISDIDGTITKSDVLGHIMPIMGNAWAQSGVAKLFNRIEDNGYKLLYLSARAIGQSKGTRRYLNSIKQEDLKLPEGPLLLNPTSLISAFHREVIEKKPEEFKISCLRDIQALFPSGSNPFYAGYGNKINDVWTYQAVGIPMFRIFTINHKGELRHELTNTFQSSYLSMSQIADQLFPVRSKQTPAEEFSEFNYWRDPIIDITELLNQNQL